MLPIPLYALTFSKRLEAAIIQMSINEFPRVYVVVLNWNGWRYTIPAVESVLSMDYEDFRIVICDNGSTDDSLSELKAWSKTRSYPTDCVPESLERLIPAVREEVEVEFLNLTESATSQVSGAKVTVISIGENLGFAAGCNVGVRYALQDHSTEYVWLLNNDALVASDSLSELVKTYRSSPNVGICGSTLLSFSSPNTVQALGGTYNRLTGSCRHIGAGEAWSGQVSPENTDYVVGASMLVNRKFLENVGLMSEKYFLYFEELDWARRAIIKGYSLAHAPGSLVYHKESGSTNGKLNLYYLYRNTLRFSFRYYKSYTPFVLCRVFARFVSALLYRRSDVTRVFVDSWFLLRAPRNKE